MKSLAFIAFAAFVAFASPASAECYPLQVGIDKLTNEFKETLMFTANDNAAPPGFVTQLWMSVNGATWTFVGVSETRGLMCMLLAGTKWQVAPSSPPANTPPSKKPVEFSS